jgi:hypothetical protein
MFERDWATPTNLIYFPILLGNTIGRTYNFNLGMNKHAIPLIITTLGEV